MAEPHLCLPTLPRPSELRSFILRHHSKTAIDQHLKDPIIFTNAVDQRTCTFVLYTSLCSRHRFAMTCELDFGSLFKTHRWPKDPFGPSFVLRRKEIGTKWSAAKKCLTIEVEQKLREPIFIRVQFLTLEDKSARLEESTNAIQKPT